MADLFSDAAQERLGEVAPLALRLRPRTLEEFVGQKQVLGEGSALRLAIAEDRVGSMILYGPPGTGKTTLARIVAVTTGAEFEELSAVSASVSDVRAVLARARDLLGGSGRRTILFLDEIHRFNKAQQDALLPAVEEGLVTLIGATTENPYFEVNSALLSRAQLYELYPLTPEQTRNLLDRALGDPERGIADPPAVSEEALSLLAGRSGGDARTALSALERAADSVRGTDREVDLEVAEDALQRKALSFDREGDLHYDYASAWIKATRASDPDASLYYLAVMLEGGEDPRFIARRMLILASEDVGNADPQALQVAAAAAYAVEHVGMPEAQLTLSQAAIYLSLAPKSKAATRAIGAARAHVREHGAKLPPSYLRSSGHPGARPLGRGQGYDSPHDHPEGVSSQELLPDEVVGARFYVPGEGERELTERLAEIRRLRGREP